MKTEENAREEPSRRWTQRGSQSTSRAGIWLAGISQDTRHSTRHFNSEFNIGNWLNRCHWAENTRCWCQGEGPLPEWWRKNRQTSRSKSLLPAARALCCVPDCRNLIGHQLAKEKCSSQSPSPSIQQESWGSWVWCLSGLLQTPPVTRHKNLPLHRASPSCHSQGILLWQEGPQHCHCLLGQLLPVLGSDGCAPQVLAEPGLLLFPAVLSLWSHSVPACFFSPTLIWLTSYIKFSLLKYLASFLFSWLTQRVKGNKGNFLLYILCIVWDFLWGYIHVPDLPHKAV